MKGGAMDERSCSVPHLFPGTLRHSDLLLIAGTYPELVWFRFIRRLRRTIASGVCCRSFPVVKSENDTDADTRIVLNSLSRMIELRQDVFSLDNADSEMRRDINVNTAAESDYEAVGRGCKVFSQRVDSFVLMRSAKKYVGEGGCVFVPCGESRPCHSGKEP